MKFSSATFSILALVAGCAAGPGTVRTDAGRATDGATADTPARDAPPSCGDFLCSEGVEDCETCPLDCGECPTCDFAPTCTGALAVPTGTEALASFDNFDGTDFRSLYESGIGLGTPVAETDCTDPQLRLRVRELHVERGNLTTDRVVYCVISADDGTHSELLTTEPRTMPGGVIPYDPADFTFAPSEAVFWGQGDLHRTFSNLTITYQCFLGGSADDARAALDEIGDRATEASGSVVGYGWVFGTVGVVGSIISGALASVDDARILDVQQTIDADALLELTNGRRWDVRNENGDFTWDGGAFRIRLTVEAWGCSTARDTTE